jgi:hypothetical protein
MQKLPIALADVEADFEAPDAVIDRRCRDQKRRGDGDSVKVDEEGVGRVEDFSRYIRYDPGPQQNRQLSLPRHADLPGVIGPIHLVVKHIFEYHDLELVGKGAPQMSE